MAQREPLTPKNGKPAGENPLPATPLAEEAAKAAQPPSITLDNVNGRLSELAEQNQLLLGRCTQLRGELADKERIITDLRAQLIAATGGKDTVLKDKRKQ